MKIGDVIELKGKSRHGKTRVAQHGNIWVIMAEKSINTVSNKVGPAWLVESFETDDSRWVLKNEDGDFEIVGVVN